MARGAINQDVVILIMGVVILALLTWKKDCVSSSISFPPAPTDQPLLSVGGNI